MAGVPRQYLGSDGSRLHKVLGDTVNLEGAAAKAPGNQRVMYHDAGMGQYLPLGTGGEQYRGHTGSVSAHGTDGTLDSLHHVVQCQTAADLAAGRVDVECDFGVGRIVLEPP